MNKFSQEASPEVKRGLNSSFYQTQHFGYEIFSILVPPNLVLTPEEKALGSKKTSNPGSLPEWCRWSPDRAVDGRAGCRDGHRRVAPCRAARKPLPAGASASWGCTDPRGRSGYSCACRCTTNVVKDRTQPSIGKFFVSKGSKLYCCASITSSTIVPDPEV
jgi:hypothetical protein